MPTFQEKSADLAKLIDKFNSSSIVLENTYSTYFQNKSLASYIAPYVSINLVSTVEYAQDAYEYYIRIKNDGELTQAEKNQLIKQFKPFKERCKGVQIDYKQPRDRAVLYANQTNTAFNPQKTVDALHLFGAAIQGLSKMTAALNSDVFPNTRIDFTNSGGTLNQKGELKVDVDMLSQSPVLPIHVISHETGHLWSNFFKGTSTSARVPFLPNLQVVLPYYVRTATSDAQKEEALADYFAAIFSGMFGVPPSVVYSLFYGLPTLPSGDQHPTGSIRSELIQSTSSILGHHYNDKDFPRWIELAERVQAIPNITYKQLPNAADFNDIIKRIPNSKEGQLLELKRQFPNLFTPTTRGDYPPPVMVAQDLRSQIMSMIYPSLFNSNRAAVPSVSIDDFQRSWQPLQPLSPVGPSILAPTIQTRPLVQNQGVGKVPQFATPQLASAPMIPLNQPRPITFRGLNNPLPYAPSKTELAPQSSNTPVTETMTANLMLGTVLGKMGKGAVQYLFPRWAQPRPKAPAKPQTTAAPSSAAPGKKTRRLGA